MRQFLPRSLAGRTVMVLIAGLVITHVVTVAVFSEHRAESLTRAEEQHISRHIASIADIVLAVPNQWRDRIVQSSDNHSFRVYMTSDERGPSLKPQGSPALALRDLLSRQVLATISEPVSVNIYETGAPDQSEAAGTGMRWLQEPLARLLYGHARDQAVLVSIPISEGQRLNFSTVMPLAEAPGWERAVAMTGSFVIVVLLLSLWAIRKLSAPVDQFAAAATAFAQSLYAPPLPEAGPSEVRKATRAFNDMQRRVRELVENRTQILAAISHDLRTPLTTLRLRAESVMEPQHRAKMLAAVNDMETMLSSTLAFSREGCDSEERSIADIGSLAQSICDDMSDTGHDVACAVSGKALAPCRPLALKRALTNLIDNAVKYGGKAEIQVTASRESVEITIDDQGPGIPAAELERVFSPFYRLDTSRNRNTGGVGLGLATAQLAIDRDGGSIHLQNRAEGGLRVRVLLPRS